MLLVLCVAFAACSKSEDVKPASDTKPSTATATAEPPPPPPPPVATADRPATVESPLPKPLQEKRKQLKGDEPPADVSRSKDKPPPAATTPGPAPELTPTPIKTAPPPGADASLVIAQPTLGSSVIKVPSTMKEGRESIAQLIVSPTDLASLLRQSAVTGSGGDVKDAEQNVRLTPRMRASISAPGFDFSPKEAQEQVVKAGEPTVWVWTLVPQSTGSLTLVFTLEGILTIDGKETAIRPPALTVPVRVEVNPLLFFEKYWQWLMTAIVIPLVVFFGKRALDQRAAAATKA
jgi:hypothetical protein